jgi:hypothetical protein
VDWTRVTRLVEFSLIGRLFSLISYFENGRSSPNLCATFLHGERSASILTKHVWATFWAIFSQTHLVTLPQAFFFSFLIKTRHALIVRKQNREKYSIFLPDGTNVINC